MLRRDGYATVVRASNGFVCIVERSCANATDDPEFWNPHIRARHCFNPAASKTFLPIFLKKTKLSHFAVSQCEPIPPTCRARVGAASRGRVQHGINH